MANQPKKSSPGYKTRFHNTIELDFTDAKKAEEKAKSLEERVLTFFKANKTQGFTPPEVMDLMKLGMIPLTSIRRAMSNLTADENLIKTKEKRPGIYEEPNHIWKLNTLKK